MNTTKTRIDRLRNVGISAHIDSGKTTLTERMLFYCGRIHNMREVRGGDGGATMDYDPIEERRGITISSAATYVNWSDHRFNVIDTPGHVDFTVEVERSLRVLDGAVLVLCSVGGVQSQSITVDRQMRRYGVPRIALINKMDRMGANPKRVIEQLRDRLDTNAVALQIPIGAGETFAGVVDLITMQAVYFNGDEGQIVEREPIPSGLVEESISARVQMLESLSLLDENLMETVVAGEHPSIEEIRRVLRDATMSRTLTPVLMASAYKNIGVQEVLDAIMYYLPAPTERKVFANDNSQKLADDEIAQRVGLSADVNAPTVVMAFKTVVEDFGQLTFLRVYQGRIEKGMTLRNARTREKIRFGRLARVHSNKREDIDSAVAGDIVGVVGIDCASGDTFAADGCDVLMENIVVAPPVMRLSIAPERREDADKLGKALDRFRRQDPTFHVVSDPQTGETIIAGMGQLHLDVYVERLRDECKCPCIVGRPSVTYKERPTKTVEFEHRLKKQTGGPGSFAHIVGRMEPLPEDCEDRFVFENEVSGGRISQSYIAAVKKGVLDAMANGPIDHYEMVGVKFTLIDGKEHEKDSSDLAFRQCAEEAMRKIVFPRCHAELLEPMMQLEIEVPSEFQGNVTGHVGRLRGIVISSELVDGECTIGALAPLAELFDYASDLRSMTQGKGCFTMQPNDFRPVPIGIQRGIVGSVR